LAAKLETGLKQAVDAEGAYAVVLLLSRPVGRGAIMLAERLHFGLGRTIFAVSEADFVMHAGRNMLQPGSFASFRRSEYAVDEGGLVRHRISGADAARIKTFEVKDVVVGDRVGVTEVLWPNLTVEVLFTQMAAPWYRAFRVVRWPAGLRLTLAKPGLLSYDGYTYPVPGLAKGAGVWVVPLRSSATGQPTLRIYSDDRRHVVVDRAEPIRVTYTDVVPISNSGVTRIGGRTHSIPARHKRFWGQQGHVRKDGYSVRVYARDGSGQLLYRHKTHTPTRAPFAVAELISRTVGDTGLVASPDGSQMWSVDPSYARRRVLLEVTDVADGGRRITDVRILSDDLMTVLYQKPAPAEAAPAPVLAGVPMVPQARLGSSRQQRADSLWRSARVLPNGVVWLADPAVPADDPGLIDALITARSLPADATRLVLAIYSGPGPAGPQCNGVDITAEDLSRLLNLLRRDGTWTIQQRVELLVAASADGGQMLASALSEQRTAAATVLRTATVLETPVTVLPVPAAGPWQESELDAIVELILDDDDGILGVWVRSPDDAADSTKRLAAVQARAPEGFIPLRIAGHRGTVTVDRREVEPRVLAPYLRTKVDSLPAQWFLQISDALQGGDNSFAARWQREAAADLVRAAESAVSTSPSTGVVMASDVVVIDGDLQPALGAPATRRQFVDRRADAAQAPLPVGSIFPTDRDPSTITDWVDGAPSDSSLSVRLLKVLERPGPVDFAAVIAAILESAATTAQRQATLVDRRVRTGVGERLSARHGTAVMFALLVGSQQWETRNKDYWTKVSHEHRSGLLPTTVGMNCVQVILYAAHLAGVLDLGQIEQAWWGSFAANDPTLAMWERIGWDANLSRYEGPGDARPGQFLFYEDEHGVVAHVVLYVGDGRALSLWLKPNSNSAVQLIRVNDTELRGMTIRVGDPPW
jgi:hypothetical protein